MNESDREIIENLEARIAKCEKMVKEYEEELKILRRRLQDALKR